MNRRATTIARDCGLDVESPFFGDVYIGRVAVQPSPARQVDFRLSELGAGSPWLSSAPSENHMYDIAMQKYEAAAISKRPGAAAAAAAKGAEEAKAAERGWSWEETSEDLELTMGIPNGLTSKDLAVVIKSTTVIVSKKAGGPPLAELSLFGRVSPRSAAAFCPGSMRFLRWLFVCSRVPPC